MAWTVQANHSTRDASENRRWSSFSATNASQNEAKLTCIRLNIRTPVLLENISVPSVPSPTNIGQNAFFHPSQMSLRDASKIQKKPQNIGSGRMGRMGRLKNPWGGRVSEITPLSIKADQANRIPLQAKSSNIKVRPSTPGTQRAAPKFRTSGAPLDSVSA
jgi:hypothetical protein